MSSIKDDNKTVTVNYKRRYEEALERAKDMLSYKEVRQEDMEYIFPELKEDEDEKIRKEIIRIVDGYFSDKASTQREKYIAWLENQKEPELGEDFGDFVERLHNQFPEVSFAKLSRIAVRVKNWLNKPVEEINGKDYGIDGLWHAIDILERTLGEVDGYQTDDGILEHKAAINAVKELYNQGPTVWKPSEVQLQCLSDAIDTYHAQGHPADALASLLKDLKRIYNP